MYAAVFEMKSMFGTFQYFFEGKTPMAIIDALEYEQSLECLIRHGRCEEDRDGQLALDRLEEFYNKYMDYNLTTEDIAALDVNLSIGTIKCHAIVEGEEAIAALKEQYPNARRS
jgi:hypothetical protein